MKTFLVLLLLVVLPLLGIGQHHFRVVDAPIFKTKDDSLAYTNGQQIFQQILAGKVSNISADSLLMQMRLMAERSIIGRKKKYYPTEDFTSIDSLLFVEDASQLTKLSISNKHFKKLPKEIYNCTNLEYLEIVNVPIRRLQRLSKFQKLTSVYVLNSKQQKPVKLSRSIRVKTFGMRGEIPNIPRSFKKLSNLEKLDLADNQLSRFPSGFKTNSHLTELSLTNNSIALEDGFMEGSPSIQKLELHRNKITYLPATIEKFPNLIKLSLNFNSIERVSENIASLKKLEQISFYNNRLTSIPHGIFQLPNIKELDLYFNQIERVDSAIWKLNSLEVLYLSNNKLISLPESIGNLHNLSGLYLSNNRLSDLPESLSNLTNLRVLRINNNYLTRTPKYINKLEKLENIDISSNMITELPYEVSNMNYLKLVVIANNPWDNQSKEELSAFIDKLRKREVIVHSD